MTTLKITRQGEQKRSYSIIILQLSFRNLFAISRTYIIFRFHTIFFSLSLSLPPSPARWLGFVVVHITTELHGKFLLFFSIYNISFYALSLFFSSAVAICTLFGLCLSRARFCQSLSPTNSSHPCLTPLLMSISLSE